MFELKMNDNWRMHESLLSVEKDQWAYVHGLEDGWYSCSLPADVRMPLIENGVIRDPVLADYCRESEWIEKRAWWFERTFDGCSVDKNEDIIELILEGLDSKSDIFPRCLFPDIQHDSALTDPGPTLIQARWSPGL